MSSGLNMFGVRIKTKIAFRVGRISNKDTFPSPRFKLVSSVRDRKSVV